MNTITIIGQLGRDPELKTSQNGKTYLQNSIYEYAGRDENGDSTYTWRDFVAFGSNAEAIARNCSRRGRLAITGTEKEKQYTDKNGQNRTRYEVSVSKVDVIDFAEKPAETKNTTPEFVPQGFAAIDEDIPF